jgi:FLVCR family MFS transporter 7
MLVGTLLNVAGAALRFAATRSDTSPQVGGYAILVAGQCLAALAQPFFMNVPARISSDWFPASQRDVAVTVGSMFNPVGIAIGTVLPPALVSAAGGFPVLMLVELAVAAAGFLLVFFFFESRPPTAPTYSQALRHAASAAASTTLSDVLSKLWGDVRACLGNRDFRVLFVGFGVGLGVFNTLTTVIEQIVAPSGYTSDDAGTFGALIIGCGLVSAGFVGAYMDASHRYNQILKTNFVLAFVVALAFVLNLQPNRFTVLCVCFGLLGALILPLLPVTFQCGVECCYPVDEETTSGLLMVSGSVLGIPMIFTMDALIAQHPRYTSVYISSSFFLVACLLLSLACVMCYNGPYLRLEADAAASKHTDAAAPVMVSPVGGGGAVGGSGYGGLGLRSVNAGDCDAKGGGGGGGGVLPGGGHRGLGGGDGDDAVHVTTVYSPYERLS